jgi:hypothetical protein
MQLHKCKIADKQFDKQLVTFYEDEYIEAKKHGCKASKDAFCHYTKNDMQNEKLHILLNIAEQHGKHLKSWYGFLPDIFIMNKSGKYIINAKLFYERYS